MLARSLAMKEISEDFLNDYKKEESVVFSRSSNYVMLSVVFLSLIYLAFKGSYYGVAIFVLLSAAVYGIYKALSRKCNSCGKSYEQANLKKILSGPEYSKLHHSFKNVTVEFCSTCKIYSEFENEPPSW